MLMDKNRERLLEEYEKALAKAREGKRVVLYVEMWGDIVLVHSEYDEKKVF